MNILHIISSGGMYGAEAVILNLSRTLNQGPHQSMLGVFSNSAQPNLQLHETATAQHLQSHLIPCNRQVDLTVPASIRSLAQQTQADVVHAHGYKADIYTFLALRNTRTPLVSTCHTWYDNNALLRLYGALDRRTLRSYAAVIAVSEEVRQRLLAARVPSHRVSLIRNGIDLSPFDRPRAAESDTRPLTVGLVGRLSQEKGIDLFLRAAARVLTHLPSTQFLIAGDGPDRPTLQSLIDDLGIGANATLLGRTEDMPAFYASLDLMVSSSRQEGLPIALLEGMASRLPIVATSVGAVPALISHQQTGLLVPAENIDALSSAILTLLQHPDLRLQYGTAAQHLIAQQFSAQRMTSDYLGVYQAVLHERHPDHRATEGQEPAKGSAR